MSDELPEGYYIYGQRQKCGEWYLQPYHKNEEAMSEELPAGYYINGRCQKCDTWYLHPCNKDGEHITEECKVCKAPIPPFEKQTVNKRKKMKKISEFIKPNMGEGYINTVSLTLNPEDNGGEAVILEVDQFRNDDGLIFTNTHISNHCYGVSTARLSFYSVGFDRLADACRSLVDHMTRCHSLRSKVSEPSPKPYITLGDYQSPLDQ